MLLFAALFVKSQDDLFYAIFSASAAVSCCPYMLMFPSVRTLRRKDPDETRPFRVPGGACPAGGPVRPDDADHRRDVHLVPVAGDPGRSGVVGVHRTAARDRRRHARGRRAHRRPPDAADPRRETSAGPGRKLRPRERSRTRPAAAACGAGYRGRTPARRRVLGVRDATLFTISAMLVIDTLTASAAIGVQTIGWWVLAIVFFMLPGALITAELGTTYPDQGGIYLVGQARLRSSAGRRARPTGTTSTSRSGCPRCSCCSPASSANCSPSGGRTGATGRDFRSPSRSYGLAGRRGRRDEARAREVRDQLRAPASRC